LVGKNTSATSRGARRPPPVPSLSLGGQAFFGQVLVLLMEDADIKVVNAAEGSTLTVYVLV
jgi:hypothetical protein